MGRAQQLIARAERGAMAAAESSAGRILKGETAAAILRAAKVVVVGTGSDARNTMSVLNHVVYHDWFIP